MADGTRLKTMDEQIKKLSDTAASLADRQDQFQASMELQQKTLREIVLQLGSVKERLDSPTPPSMSVLSPSPSLNTLDSSTFAPPVVPSTPFPQPIVPSASYPPPIPFTTPLFPSRPHRMDFPHFNGEDVTGWLFRASQYFQVFPTSDDQRLLIAAIHMEGRALQWFQWASHNAQFRSWLKFTQAIEHRFGPSEYDDPQGALAKLVQKTSVDAYFTSEESMEFSEIEASMDSEVSRIMDMNLDLQLKESSAKLELEPRPICCEPTNLLFEKNFPMQERPLLIDRLIICRFEYNDWFSSLLDFCLTVEVTFLKGYVMSMELSDVWKVFDKGKGQSLIKDLQVVLNKAANSEATDTLLRFARISPISFDSKLENKKSNFEQLDDNETLKRSCVISTNRNGGLSDECGPDNLNSLNSSLYVAKYVPVMIEEFQASVCENVCENHALDMENEGNGVNIKIGGLVVISNLEGVDMAQSDESITYSMDHCYEHDVTGYVSLVEKLCLRSTSLVHSGLVEGIIEHIFLRFSSPIIREKPLQKLEDGNQNLEDEIPKIRHVFNASEKRFLQTSVAFPELPRLDPKGIRVHKNSTLEYIDMNQAIQHVHRSGLTHRRLLSDPQEILVQNALLRGFLRMVRGNGKKLFLLPNYSFYFVDSKMHFMLEGSLEHKESLIELLEVMIPRPPPKPPPPHACSVISAFSGKSWIHLVRYHPAVNLEDKVHFEGEGNVMTTGPQELIAHYRAQVKKTKVLGRNWAEEGAEVKPTYLNINRENRGREECGTSVSFSSCFSIIVLESGSLESTVYLFLCCNRLLAV